VHGVRISDQERSRLCSLLKNKTITIIGAGSTLGRSLAYFFDGLRKYLDVHLHINLVASVSSRRKYILSEFAAEFYDYQSAGYCYADYVFYLASPASPGKYLKFPIDTIGANTTELMRVLMEASAHTKFYYFSSTGVYGDIDRSEIVPDELDKFGFSNHLDPNEVYVQAKRIGEAICASCRHVTGMEITILRPSITYTPFLTVDDNRLHSQVLLSLVTKEFLALQSDGLDKRNFLFVLDFIGGLIKILLSNRREIVYNVTNPESMSILDYLKEVSNVDFNGHRLNTYRSDTHRSAGSNFGSTSVSNRWLTELGWAPRWTLQEAYNYIALAYDRFGEKCFQ
jgi:nucleoside-diphosphate-sugar epimerase